MGLDRNYKGVDENCREINLIQGSHFHRERERLREREREALMH